MTAEDIATTVVSHAAGVEQAVTTIFSPFSRTVDVVWRNHAPSSGSCREGVERMPRAVARHPRPDVEQIMGVADRMPTHKGAKGGAGEHIVQVLKLGYVTYRVGWVSKKRIRFSTKTSK